jgi:D-3-phosphoglycerate dehydrogenase
MNLSHLKILHIDSNHPLLWEQLEQAFGFQNEADFTSSKQEIEAEIENYHGIIIRSRFKIDKTFLDKATNLQFIARVGAGLESIDCDYATAKGIHLIAAPEGNANAVGEHAIGMLLSLFNNLNKANNEVKSGSMETRSQSRTRIRRKNELELSVMEIWENRLLKSLRGFDVDRCML